VRLALGALLLAAAATPAGAAYDGLLSNGWFNGSTSGWSLYSPGVGSILYSAVDHDGSGASGSLVLTNDTSAEGITVIAKQCVSGLSGYVGQRFLVGADIRLAAGPQSAGSSGLSVMWLDGDNCTGASVHQSAWTATSSDDGTNWQSASFRTVPAPAGARSAYIGLRARKAGMGGSTAFHFDRAYFCPEASHCDALLVHGFENGSTVGWSATTP
jgi:hypothetical protein